MQLVFILHNSQDKVSRNFISSLPADTDVPIIDWYVDFIKRYLYNGPPPRAFATGVFQTASGQFGTVEPQTWEDTINATESDLITICNPDDYIGGTTVENLQQALNGSLWDLSERDAIIEGLKAYYMRTTNVTSD